MARKCALSGKGVLTGNNVSHANNKNRRRFLPNLQRVTLRSDKFGESFRLRVSVKTLRSVDHRGGLDAYVLGARSADLPPDLRRLKKRLQTATAS